MKGRYVDETVWDTLSHKPWEVMTPAEYVPRTDTLLLQANFGKVRITIEQD